MGINSIIASQSTASRWAFGADATGTSAAKLFAKPAAKSGIGQDDEKKPAGNPAKANGPALIDRYEAAAQSSSAFKTAVKANFDLQSAYNAKLIADAKNRAAPAPEPEAEEPAAGTPADSSMDARFAVSLIQAGSSAPKAAANDPGAAPETPESRQAEAGSSAPSEPRATEPAPAEEPGSPAAGDPPATPPAASAEPPAPSGQDEAGTASPAGGTTGAGSTGSGSSGGGFGGGLGGLLGGLFGR